MFQATSRLFRRPTKSRKQVNDLIAKQWQRERMHIQSIIEFNNPHYAKIDHNASQL